MKDGDIILILENVGYLYNFENFHIVKTFGSGEHELNFTISKYHNLYKSIFEEMNILYKGKNRYTIKSIDEQAENVDISCRLALEDLQKNIILDYKQINQHLYELLSFALTGSGWNYKGDEKVSKRVTNELECGNPLDLLRLAQKNYNVVFEYDTINKIIEVVPLTSYKNKGVYFTDELNLKQAYLRSDSFDYCTRLIPIGAEGLKINAINDGKPYVENFQYSSKIITRVWKDERFTDAQSLKDEAIEKLKVLSKPTRTYDLSVIDMASIDSKNYKNLSFDLGDIVTLVDRFKKVKVEHQIVKLVQYPEQPERSTAELNITSNGIESIIQDLTGLIDGNKTVIDIHRKKIAQMIFDIDSFTVKLGEYYKKGETEKYVLAQIKMATDRIDLIIDEVTNIVDSNTGAITLTNKKVGQLEVTTDNIIATVSDISNTVDSNTGAITVTSEKVGKLEVTTNNITSTVSNISNIVDSNTGVITLTNKKVGQLEVTTNNITSTVSNISNIVDSNTGVITSTNKKVGQLEVTLDSINLSVSDIQQAVGNNEAGKETGIFKKIAQIQITTDKIKSEVSEKVGNSEFATKLQQSATDIQIAWNNISEYIQFINSKLNIKDYYGNILMSLSKTGMSLYNDGIYVGEFTTDKLMGIYGTTQTCAENSFIAWKDRYNAFVLSYFDSTPYDTSLYRMGLNCRASLRMHGFTIFLDNAGASIGKYGFDGNIGIAFSRSGKCSIVCGSSEIACFTASGLDLKQGTIYNATVLNTLDYQSNFRAATPSTKEFHAVYGTDKIYTYIDTIDIQAGENIINLPVFFRLKGLNYHVFISKQGKGDIWYCDKTQTNFKIVSENAMKISYEIKLVVTESEVKK